jgi:HTH-type transcriptional regulator/antitoxin HipB
MKRNSWDSYLNQQLKKPKFKEAFERESRMLNLGIALAKKRESKGLTQAAVAKRIGTSVPQVSRTERRPESANVQTLMRYAAALGMRLDLKLVPQRHTKKYGVAAVGR